jgi:hypothetical protein
MVPVVLLPFAVLVAASTATCIYEMAHWNTPLQERLTLIAFYSPYVAMRKQSPFLSISCVIFSLVLLGEVRMAN